MPETGQRFLVIRLSSIGDIVHTLPAVAELGHSFPRAEIHWLVEKRFSSLLNGNPFVQRVIELDTLGWRENWFGSSVGQSWRAVRKERYDAAIDFQGLLKTGILSFAAHAKRRVGFGREWLRERGAGMFYTDRVQPLGRGHIIERNLALVEHLGAKPGPWEFPLLNNQPETKLVAERLTDLGVKNFILISPGGGWKAKRWPPESFSELIRRIANELQPDILLTGSPAEEPLIAGILEQANVARARYFPATLVQFIALARRARLFVGGDTGPLHLAAAVTTPLVAIFDASDPLNTVERNGPFNPADITVTDAAAVRGRRSGKNSDFLRGIPVEAVLEAVRERWKKAYG